MYVENNIKLKKKEKRIKIFNIYIEIFIFFLKNIYTLHHSIKFNLFIQDIRKGDESFNQRRTAMQSVEKMQKQLDKYKDEIDSLRIANDTKDKRLMELKEKISNQESAVNKGNNYIHIVKGYLK